MTLLTSSYVQAQSYQSQSAMNAAAAQSAASQYQFAAARNNASIMRDSGKITGDIYSPVTCGELEHPAYEAPVSVLIDMWLVRFGNDWVDIESVDNDDFFRLAFKRLKAMGELEVHYLTDRARYVCRKPK